MVSSRVTFLTLLIAALLLGQSPAARADDYPAKPIKLLVGASAGGTTDTMARAIAQPLSVSLGKAVLVENRPGAGGNLAADAVAKAPPDGYTLLVSFTSHTINATLYPKLPFDPVADFTPIGMISTVPSMLVGNPKVPAKDLKELIALAKAKPDTLTIGIGGIGSSLHLAGDQFKMMADVNILNVPYKGTAPALTDVLGGQIDLMFISLVTGRRAGPRRQAARLWRHQRGTATVFPELPAIGEIVTGFESEAWFGVFGPAKLPDDITNKLNAAIAAALNDPKMREQLQHEGANPVVRSPTDFAAFVRQDVKRWEPIVKRSGASRIERSLQAATSIPSSRQGALCVAYANGSVNRRIRFQGCRRAMRHDEPTIALSEPSADEIKTTTCYMCACRCGIRVHLKDGRVHYIDGNRDHPVNRGVICGKGRGRHHDTHLALAIAGAAEARRTARLRRLRRDQLGRGAGHCNRLAEGRARTAIRRSSPSSPAAIRARR